jgi:hypothetical protein
VVWFLRLNVWSHFYTDTAVVSCSLSVVPKDDERANSPYQELFEALPRQASSRHSALCSLCSLLLDAGTVPVVPLPTVLLSVELLLTLLIKINLPTRPESKVVI